MARRTLAGGTASIDELAGQRAHRPDYKIVLYIGLLMLIGLVIMYAIGPQRANVMNSVHGTDFYTDTYFAVKQLVSLSLAVVAFFIMSRVPFGWWKKHASAVLFWGFGACLLLVLVGNVLKIDAIATNTLGAYRWFNLGPLGSFQPVEVLKFGLLLYSAVFLGARAQQGLLGDIHKTVIPLVAVVLAALFLVVVVQKDMGTGVAIGGIAAAMVFVSGMNRRILLTLGVGVLAVGLVSVVIAPHRMERITTFLRGDDHSSQVDDSNYHIRNAMIALGTGGFFGRGIGNSIQATGYLPEAINDSVFAIIGETFGFFGVCIILGIFAALLMRLLHIADRLPDLTMRLVVAGVFGWLFAHVVLNVASMIGVIPLTGITLPLLSFGGTSMLFITGAMGLAFQLSRYTYHQPMSIKEDSSRENLSSRRRVGRTRVASRRSM